MSLTKTPLPFTDLEVCTLEQMIAYQVCEETYLIFSPRARIFCKGESKTFKAAYHDTIQNALECCYEDFIQNEVLYSFTDQIPTINTLIANNLENYLLGYQKELDPHQIGEIFQYPVEAEIRVGGDII